MQNLNYMFIVTNFSLSVLRPSNNLYKRKTSVVCLFFCIFYLCIAERGYINYRSTKCLKTSAKKTKELSILCCKIIQRNYSTFGVYNPVVTYINAGEDKAKVLKENKNKSGVYR